MRTTSLANPRTALLAVLVAGLVAGCGQPAQRPPEPAPPASPPATAEAASPPSELPPATPAPEAAGYPDTPRAYAEAVVAAWSAGDLTGLADLTTAQVHDQLIQIPGPPAPDWTWIQCDNIAYCTFYNGEGDHLALQIPVAQLGQAHAAGQVSFTSTTFPTDHLDYLKEFTAAWQNGNLARMHLLARPDVVAAYQQFPPAPVSNYGLAGGGGGLSIIVVTTVSTEIETHLGTTLLGGPQAIIHAVPEI